MKYNELVGIAFLMPVLFYNRYNEIKIYLVGNEKISVTYFLFKITVTKRNVLK